MGMADPALVGTPWQPNAHRARTGALNVWPMGTIQKALAEPGRDES
jgi:hypothetical protein